MWLKNGNKKPNWRLYHHAWIHNKIKVFFISRWSPVSKYFISKRLNSTYFIIRWKTNLKLQDPFRLWIISYQIFNSIYYYLWPEIIFTNGYLSIFKVTLYSNRSMMVIQRRMCLVMCWCPNVVLWHTCLKYTVCRQPILRRTFYFVSRSYFIIYKLLLTLR